LFWDVRDGRERRCGLKEEKGKLADHAETPGGFWKRITRFHELAHGLSVEAGKIQQGQDPLLYAERRDYLRSLHAAIAALENARVVLALAQQRVRDRAEERKEKGPGTAEDRQAS
jgi:hypothetical protein